MKKIILLFTLIITTIQVNGQYTRFKLNQLEKDTKGGSVLTSSPVDYGMVYSTDLYINYGVADTFLVLGSDTIRQSVFVDDGTYVYYDGTKNIGIGTSSPVSELHLKGSKNSGVDFFIENTNNNPFSRSSLALIQEYSNFSITNYSDSTNATASGLSLADKAVISSSNGMGGIVYLPINGQNYFFYNTSFDDDLLFIDATNDKVGIETTTPSEKLDVNGNARFRSIGSASSSNQPLYFTSTGVLSSASSDVRLKTNFNPLENTLEKLMNVKTYTFNWLADTATIDIGMIAQELEIIFPKLVFTNPVDGYKGIHYNKFGTILTKAIQEQQSIIDTQSTKIEGLETTIQSQQQQIQDLVNKITDLTTIVTNLQNN